MKKISDKLRKEVLPLVEEAWRHCAILKEYYAKNRGSLMDSMTSMITLICIHWCLIYCARKYGFGAENLAHWGGEVRAFLKTVVGTKLKIGDAPKARLKMATQAWQNVAESGSKGQFIDAIAEKLCDEGISNSQMVQEAFDALMNEKSTIISLLASTSMDEVEQYIQQLTQTNNGTDLSQQRRGGRKRR